MAINLFGFEILRKKPEAVSIQAPIAAPVLDDGAINVSGGFGPISGAYKTGIMAGVDFVIAYDADPDPTAAQAAFSA